MVFRKRASPNTDANSELIETLEELSAVSWRMAARMKWAKSISDAEAEHQRRQATAKINGITNY